MRNRYVKRIAGMLLIPRERLMDLSIVFNLNFLSYFAKVIIYKLFYVRYLKMLFVDREEELRTLKSLVRNKIFVLIYGLRGIGKSALLDKLSEELRSEFDILKIDGYRVSSLQDISEILGLEVTSSKSAIKNLLSLDHKVIIIDEFSALFEMFSRDEELGTLEEVAKLFRHYLQERRNRGGNSVILCGSNIGVIKKLAMRYFAPLFREFKIMRLGNMPLSGIVKLAKLRGLGDKDALEIAQLSGGNPLYAIKIIEEVLAGKKPREALEHLLSPSGDLDIYFSVLFESLDIDERRILYLISRGFRRFKQIKSKMFRDPAPFLKKLELNGIIYRIRKGKKFVEYEIADRLFRAWLQHQELPSLGKNDIKTIIISSLGFEALVRELFRAINREIEIEDVNQKAIRLEPYVSVYNIRRGGVEIDLLAVTKNQEAIVAEIHFGEPAKKKKVLQAIRNSEIVKEMGYKVIDTLLISYFGFEKETLEEANKAGVKLLKEEQLRQIEKKLGISIGF